MTEETRRPDGAGMMSERDSSKLLTSDDMKRITKNQKYEVLCNDGKFYWVDMEVIEGNASLHYPNYHKKWDRTVPLPLLYIAFRGSFSKFDGINDNNEYVSSTSSSIYGRPHRKTDRFINKNNEALKKNGKNTKKRKPVENAVEEVVEEEEEQKLSSQPPLKKSNNSSLSTQRKEAIERVPEENRDHTRVNHREKEEEEEEGDDTILSFEVQTKIEDQIKEAVKNQQGEEIVWPQLVRLGWSRDGNTYRAPWMSKRKSNSFSCGQSTNGYKPNIDSFDGLDIVLRYICKYGFKKVEEGTVVELERNCIEKTTSNRDIQSQVRSRPHSAAVTAPSLSTSSSSSSSSSSSNQQGVPLLPPPPTYCCRPLADTLINSFFHLDIDELNRILTLLFDKKTYN